MSLFTWSKTALSNTVADSSINWQEGQSPGSVNGSARAMMAAVAKYRDDTAGMIATAGTQPTYTLTTNQVFTSLSDGLTVCFRCHSGNTGSSGATINVDSLGAKALRQYTTVHIVEGRLIAGSIYGATYRLSTDEWILHSSYGSAFDALSVADGNFYVGNGTAIVAESGATARASLGLQNVLTMISSMVGSVTDYAGATAPNGWLLCYGQAISRTTYADLFTAISTTYGIGDGSTTFNLPDIRGRVVAGQDDMGGTSANRLTDLSGGLDGNTLGDTGGAETHTLTTAQTEAHYHLLTASGGVAEASTADNYLSESRTGSGDAAYTAQGRDTAPDRARSSSVGGGEAHNNVQPTIILNKIIFTGVFS